MKHVSKHTIQKKSITHNNNNNNNNNNTRREENVTELLGEWLGIA